MTEEKEDHVSPGPSRLDSDVTPWVRVAVGLAGFLAGVFFAFGVPIFWLLRYLKTGVWHPSSTLEWLASWGWVSRRWVEDPRDWIGLWNVFNWMPAWTGSVILGVVVCVVGLVAAMIIED